jgi:hypothetical protein
MALLPAPLLERLSFSIPIIVSINAPVDEVWGVLIDIPSYPLWLSSVIEATPVRGGGVTGSIEMKRDPGNEQVKSNIYKHTEDVDNNDTNNNNANSGAAASSSISTAAAAVSTPSLVGSTWKITRISVVENQRYSVSATVTQCSDGDEDRGRGGKRSITFSTHDMLGATSSLRFTVEPIADTVAFPPPPPTPDSNLSKKREQQHVTSAPSAAAVSPPASMPSSLQIKNELAIGVDPAAAETISSGRQSCRLTLIVTMVPYQLFVKLLGIMCCLCLLKYRARMATECDLEELAVYCEGRVARQPEQLQEDEVVEEKQDDNERNQKRQPQYGE